MRATNRDSPNFSSADDDLDLRSAVVGPGLTLHRSRRGRLVLHALSPHGVARIGSFADAARAMEALDALDAA